MNMGTRIFFPGVGNEGLKDGCPQQGPGAAAGGVWERSPQKLTSFFQNNALILRLVRF